MERNKTVLTSFAILCLLSTVLMGLALNIQPVKAEGGTIYIRADGSIEPPTADITSVDNVAYYFVDNIFGEIVVERSNIIIDGNGYTLQGAGSGIGFCWSGINNVTIKNTNIKEFSYGVNIANSQYNSISGNNITNNGYGIWFDSCSGNSVYHNNFINNINQVYTSDSVNVWDNGYPSGGNYWSDHDATDLCSGVYQNEPGSDGIGDTSYWLTKYVIYPSVPPEVRDQRDNYPLMGLFSDFDFTVADKSYGVSVISNSTVSACTIHCYGRIVYPPPSGLIGNPQNAVSFKVAGTDGSTGFCQVMIPAILLNGSFTVYVDGVNTTYTLLSCSNGTHHYLYFTYTHSTHEVTIVSEFPSFPILSLFMIPTLLTVTLYRRKKQY